ncbi:hypothetical protein ACFWQD_06375 [Alcaligenes faecalis]|uniref:hypothetical protein n=1 Tax=Alcaligenes faecalis TaxID=511 RepID=UPI0036695FE1
MAKHTVKSFSVTINQSQGFVRVEIHTELLKPYIFHLYPDTNYPTLQDLADQVRAALQHCVNTFTKADISIFADRRYVTISVAKFLQTRMTGVRV